MARRGPTLRDVATAAGVSVWTVSTTYNSPEKVAEATRQRVLDAAGELGYPGPHPGARSLARGRTGALAFIAPGDSDVLLGDPAAALIARGLLSACHRGGYSLLLSGRASGEMVDGRVFYRDATGADGRVPTVVIEGVAGAGVEVVGADVRGAASDMTAYLYGLGHRDVAVLACAGTEDRLEGVRDGWGGDGTLQVFSVDDLGARSPDGAAAPAMRPGPAVGEALARAALSRSPRPTAVLALYDTLAFSALSAAHWLGLDVPGDVSIAGLDDLPDSAALGLTSALIAYRPLGERAGDILTAQLAGAPLPTFPALPTPLSIRRTTGPPRAPASARRISDRRPRASAPE